MKVRFAADRTHSTGFRGFYLFSSAFIRSICVIRGESTLFLFASFFLCGSTTLREIRDSQGWTK
ncbi:MAG: hypothetical protein DSY55_03280 [Clostridia bacterium]|nr:MAG: hypothetical protein DSY55_03280 [Clostridia bacterium]